MVLSRRSVCAEVACHPEQVMVWEHLLKGWLRERRQPTHPTLDWLYRIDEQRDGGALVCWANITQQQIVDAMNAWAKFKVGQAVHIGAFSPRHIRGRTWDFRRGTFLYIIEGNREGPEKWMDEEGVGKLQLEAKERASPK